MEGHKAMCHGPFSSTYMVAKWPLGHHAHSPYSLRLFHSLLAQPYWQSFACLLLMLSGDNQNKNLIISVLELVILLYRTDEEYPVYNWISQSIRRQSYPLDISAATQAGTLQQSTQSYFELGPGLLT